MLLHVGADVTVLVKDVVVLVNMRSGMGEATREFLGNMRHKGAVEPVGEGKPKSMVVLRDRVVSSPISSVTLKRRAEEKDVLGDLE
ncbi:MAG: DUF370 domain-containing protein [Firmicutes bacterium]|nr:DUF370 domain-containing protein [Bacillota bacterium]